MNHIIRQNEIKETFSSLQVPVEVYSRVVGYYRPVSQWHAGKKQEFRDRVCLKFEISAFK